MSNMDSNIKNDRMIDTPVAFPDYYFSNYNPQFGTFIDTWMVSKNDNYTEYYKNAPEDIYKVIEYSPNFYQIVLNNHISDLRNIFKRSYGKRIRIEE